MLKRWLFLTLLVCLVCVGLVACSGQKTTGPMNPEDRLALANQLKADRDFTKAITQYETLLSEFPAQEIAEQARFNLAVSRLEIRMYDLARNDFESFIDSYPRSDLVDDAMYHIARSYMAEAPRPERDQINTVKALDELNLLLREFPDTDLREAVEAAILECRSKLAEKDYLSGKLYLRMGSYRAAQVYFDLVIEEYGDTIWAAHALLGKAKAHVKRKQYNEAREIFERVKAEYPDTRMGQEATWGLRGLPDVPQEGEQQHQQEQADPQEQTSSE